MRLYCACALATARDSSPLVAILFFFSSVFWGNEECRNGIHQTAQPGNNPVHQLHGTIFSFDWLLKRVNSAPLQPVDISFDLDLLILNEIFIWCIVKSFWGFKPES